MIPEVISPSRRLVPITLATSLAARNRWRPPDSDRWWPSARAGSRNNHYAVPGCQSARRTRDWAREPPETRRGPACHSVIGWLPVKPRASVVRLHWHASSCEWHTGSQGTVTRRAARAWGGRGRGASRWNLGTTLWYHSLNYDIIVCIYDIAVLQPMIY